MPGSIRDALIQQLALNRYALCTLSADDNRLSLLDATPHVGQVSLLTEADAITVFIGGHTTVRFAVGNYNHVRDSMRAWCAVADAVEFVEQLVAARQLNSGGTCL